ncbi:MAG: T9SS type A sorting domain-containing protein [Bacteroidota bacterium]
MKRLIVVTLCLFVTLSMVAQVWEYTLNSNNAFNSIRDVEPTNDGGCLMIGTTGPAGWNTPKQIQLIKLDVDGQEQWVNQLGDSQLGSWNGGRIDQSSTGEFAFVGTNGSNVVVFKLDNQGNVLWTSNIGGTTWNWDGMKDIKFLSNGDLVVVYYESSFSGVKIVKLSSDGNIVWTISEDPYFRDVSLAVDDADQFIINAYQVSPYGTLLKKYDSDGGLIWATGLDSLGRVEDLVYLGNDNFAFGGSSNLLFGTIDAFGVDSYHDMSFIQAQYPQIRTNRLGAHSDGGAMISMYDPSYGKNILVKLDDSFSPEWTVDFFIASDTAGFAVEELADQRIVVAGNNNGSAYAAKIGLDGTFRINTITGNVFYDEDDFCGTANINTTSVQDWLVTATKGNQVYSTICDENGDFSMVVDTGTYQLEAYVPNDLWVMCTPFETVSTLVPDETIVQDLQASPTGDCPNLVVNMTTMILQRCLVGDFVITIHNDGTITSENTILEIVLDPYLSYLSANPPPFQINGDTLLFNVGDIPVHERELFFLNVNVSCDAILGQTHCTSAEAWPGQACAPFDPLWDQSDIDVSATCEGDSIRFFIENVGTGDMAASKGYFLYEEIYLERTGQFQLNSGEIMEVATKANSLTYRLEANQSAGHPISTSASMAVEGCSPYGPPYSTGIVNMFPQDDEAPALDIDCIENVGPYDPNDKQGFPKGIGSNHYIEANVDLEYRIRFQNTGTAPAINVVIRDTLPAELDVTSLQMGASSHNYTYDIVNGHILKVSFNDIMLPDSNTNFEASIGFFEFKIKQEPDLPAGTIINNSAAIYFDFNEPIITNIYFHEIGDDFFLTNIEEVEPDLPGVEVIIFPNPFREETQIEILGSQFTNFEFQVYSAVGQLIDYQSFSGNQFNYRQDQLPPGLYFYEIRSGNQHLQSGKLMVQ